MWGMMMSKFYIMVDYHRIAVADADTRDEINKKFIKLSEFKGYKDKMIILERCEPMKEEKAGDYPFPDYDSNIDEEETQP